MSKKKKTSRARSNKNKGRLGQQEIQKLIVEYFSELEMDDCRSNPMGAGGEDILLSPQARKILPFNIEVKRKKAIAACRFMEQAGGHGGYEPLAVFREDRGPWYACVSLDYLFTLLKRGVL